LRVLWLMACGRREDRRMLSLDVWRLFNAAKLDSDTYLRTGVVRVWSKVTYVPPNPLIDAEIERLKAEKKNEQT